MYAQRNKRNDIVQYPCHLARVPPCCAGSTLFGNQCGSCLLGEGQRRNTRYQTLLKLFYRDGAGVALKAQHLLRTCEFRGITAESRADVGCRRVEVSVAFSVRHKASSELARSHEQWVTAASAAPSSSPKLQLGRADCAAVTSSQ